VKSTDRARCGEGEPERAESEDRDKRERWVKVGKHAVPVDMWSSPRLSSRLSLAAVGFGTWWWRWLGATAGNLRALINSPEAFCRPTRKKKTSNGEPKRCLPTVGICDHGDNSSIVRCTAYPRRLCKYHKHPVPRSPFQSQDDWDGALIFIGRCLLANASSAVISPLSSRPRPSH
jgi:hypothetical protein